MMQSLTHTSRLPLANVTRTQRPVRQAGFASQSATGMSRARLVVRAEDADGDAAFEQKLAKLKTAKGEMPIGESRKETEKAKGSSTYYDYSDEEVFYEGSPSAGDLAINVALGATLIWLPLTAASIGRFAFVKYRVTDKRVSVTTKAPWQDEQVDIAYQEVADVVAIGRGIGAWGDMVITLRNGDKVEIRSLERWQEIKDYILSRKAALTKEEEPPAGFI